MVLVKHGVIPNAARSTLASAKSRGASVLSPPFGGPVLVRGVGRRFSGVYYVESVRTTLDSGVLSQSFVATRNATGQTGSEDFGQSAEEVSAQ